MLNFAKKLSAFVFVSIILAVPVGCGKAAAPPAESQSFLAAVQENNYLTARLFGMMTFDFNGQYVTFPTELKIASVPVQWMGPLFNGEAKNGSPGNITDQIHGSLSEDGAWVSSLTYSRLVVGANIGTVYYRVTLKNVPIAQTVNGTATNPGSFEKTGDIQKFVEKIEYTTGLSDGRTLGTGTTYLATDWENPNQGLMPTLKLTFERAASQMMGPPPAQSGSPTQSGMMGK